MLILMLQTIKRERERKKKTHNLVLVSNKLC